YADSGVQRILRHRISRRRLRHDRRPRAEPVRPHSAARGKHQNRRLPVQGAERRQPPDSPAARIAQRRGGTAGFRVRGLLAFVAGALAPLSFSPVDWWPLAIVSAAAFYVLLQNTTPRRAAQLAWCYGFGFFGVGTSWVYVSIHDFGNVPPALAGLLTLLFVAGLALFTTLQ